MITNDHCVALPQLSFKEFQTDNQIHVYPNPGTDDIYIETSAADVKSAITLFNNIGQKVYQSLSTEPLTSIVCNGHFTTGLYNLSIDSPSEH